MTGKLTPARWPRHDAPRERLLHIDPRAGTLRDGRISDLPALLRPGDLLVVNDAATLPGSLQARSPAVELRLLGERPDGSFRAVLFGAGDWRTPTEHRPPPPELPAGARIELDGLAAAVERVDPLSPRLVDIRFDRAGAALWPLLYKLGRPVQYSYAAAPLEMWHVQLAYASRPWAAEMPSAGRPLTWDLLQALQARGVKLASVTHAAGLSSTGDPKLDAALPLPERYEVPESTARAAASASRVVAVGTSVVRALEAAQQTGVLTGETALVLGPGYQPRAVDGLLTGVHEKSASHYALLHAFAGEELLARASAYAEERGYLSHEFGDSCLLLEG